jgi:hypothetical protein
MNIIVIIRKGIASAESIIIEDIQLRFLFIQRRIPGIRYNKPTATASKYILGLIEELQSVNAGTDAIKPIIIIVPVTNSHHTTMLVLVGSLALFIPTPRFESSI